MPAPQLLLGGLTSTSVCLRVESSDSMPKSVELRPAAAAARFGARRTSPLGRPGTSWRVDVDGLAPQTVYELRIREVPGACVRFRTPPLALADRGLLVALLSCYFPSDQYVRNAGSILRCFEERARRSERFRGGMAQLADAMPHLAFLCGDQIYADVPREPGLSLEGIYRARYGRVWDSARYGGLMTKVAVYCVGDDHEFWNGYPELMPWLTRSWPGQWKKTAAVATEAHWNGQGQWNTPFGMKGGEQTKRCWSTGRISGVDVFVADTRSERTSRDGARDPLRFEGRAPEPRFMSETQLRAIELWTDEIASLGVLVVGQPIVQKGNATDSALSDYRSQYARLVRALRHAVEVRGVSVIVLTGDIHWGRLISWQPGGERSPARLVEFISSPIALVALGSILGLGIPIKPKAKVQNRPEPAELALFARHFGPAPPTLHCATNENNLGMLELTAGIGGRPHARFEHWELERSTIAYDDWNGRGRLAAVEMDL
jgi:hypothetical protein